MRPAVVRLIDVGFDDDFATSMAFAQSLIQSIGVTTRTKSRDGETINAVEIEFVRTRDVRTIEAALQRFANVVHIMGHGDSTEEFQGFFSSDEETELSLAGLAERFAEVGEGIEAPVVFADCCLSAQGRFLRAVRDCIEQPITYIGSTRSVNWHEATVFASAFYGAYFKDKGKGLEPSERGRLAAVRAIEGYSVMVDGRCPFKVQTLKPSRTARSALNARL